MAYSMKRYTWNNLLDLLPHLLPKLHFRPNKCEPFLFIFSSNGHAVYLLVYVVDIIITSSNTSLLTSIINKHLGDLDYFLCIEVKPSAQGSMLLTQTKYIRDLLQKTHMVDSSPINSLMRSSCKLTKHRSPALDDPYM